MPIRIEDEEWFQCPRRPLKDHPRFYAELIRHWHFYRNGFLPDPGGLNQQSYALVRMLHHMDGIVEEVREAKRSEEEARRKRQAALNSQITAGKGGRR